MERDEFLLHVGLEVEVLESWLEAGWLTPAREEDICRFSEVDLARARLISDLQRDFGVNDEAVPIILDLLDQVYGLRRTMSEFRRRVLAEMQEAGLASGRDALAGGRRDGEGLG